MIPTGVIKAFAESAARFHERFWHKQNLNSLTDSFFAKDSLKVLTAENLHSVRFSGDPIRYQRFLKFILDANSCSNFDLTVRSHPGKRTLEKTPRPKPILFFEKES